jgi:hypothetical protein
MHNIYLCSFHKTEPHPKEDEPTEAYCSDLLDTNTTADIPEECKKYASIKAKLHAKSSSSDVADPYAGMSAGSRTNVRNAQIKRRMSTRHGQGPVGKKNSWF